MPFFRKRPLAASAWPPLDRNRLPFAGFATSLPEEHDYSPEIEGRLPDGLSGSLYRNGPGLFDRGRDRKRMLLDGDGLIQAFHFQDGRVRYVNRFVRTEKFIAESHADRFLFPTWTTLVRGGPFRNAGSKSRNQAGVTVIRRGDRVFAFDEARPPYELSPDTLATKGETVLDPQAPQLGFNAHFKVDGRTGEWLNLSIAYGKQTVAHIVGIDAMGKVQTRKAIPLPRRVYLHDWFVTEHHFGFILHPAFVNLAGALKVKFGLDVTADLIRWQPEKGNLVLLAPREGSGPSRVLEAEGTWMWHSMNAHEAGDEIIVDFVGATIAGGLASDDSPLYQIMRGVAPVVPAAPTSTVRRYVLPGTGRRVREERLADDYNYELPFVDARRVGYRHRHAYVIRADPGQLFWSTLCRLDAKTGAMDTYRFGDRKWILEPVFAPGEGADAGWVLTQGYDGETRKGFLAIFDAARIGDGPMAMLRLTHHVPMNFHGFWYALNTQR